MFLISVSKFWKTQTVIACLSLVSFQVISLQSLTEDLLNTHAFLCCYLQFFHLGKAASWIFFTIFSWYLRFENSWGQRSIPALCALRQRMTQENSHSEKDLFDWGVLSCGRLMETGVCLWCCPQSVLGQSFYDVYCLGSKSIFTVPSTTWTTQWCWCWLPYNWRHNSASTMKVCLESLIDWLNFTGHVELLAIFCCGYPVLLNEFKHMNILFIGEFLLFTLTFIMCIFLKRWSKIYLFLTIFSGGQKWSKRRWCHYTPVIPTLGRQRQEDPELKTIWGYTLNFMFKVKDNNNNTMNKNTFFL